MCPNAFWFNQCTGHISTPDGVILREMHLKWCIIYLDDIIVFSKTPEEHIERLRGVFEKLSAARLKLKPSKCEFFKSKIIYLGHIVSKDGNKTEKKKVTTIQEWPIPKTVTEVHSFLGFTNYYHKFYTQILLKLHDLLISWYQGRIPKK